MQPDARKRSLRVRITTGIINTITAGSYFTRLRPKELHAPEAAEDPVQLSARRLSFKERFSFRGIKRPLWRPAS